MAIGRASEIIEITLKIIKSGLESGQDVLISGFGKFCFTEKKQRRGRNPATGQDMMLRPRRVVTFECSGKLRSKINRFTGDFFRRRSSWEFSLGLYWD